MSNPDPYGRVTQGSNPFSRPSQVRSDDEDDEPDPRAWEEPTFYDFKGAAERVGRSLSTIYRWKALGQVHTIAGMIQTAELLEAERVNRIRGGDQTRAVSTERGLTRKEAAARVGRSERTIRSWQSKHGLVTVGGLIPVAALLDLARQMDHRIGRPRKGVTLE